MNKLNGISEKLAFFQIHIINKNYNNAFDINRYIEHLFVPIFNALFDGDFKRLDNAQIISPGIDLGCDKSKVSVQITSQNKYKKIEDCLSKYTNPKNGFLTKYDKLIILFIGNDYNLRKTDAAINKDIDTIYTKHKYQNEDRKYDFFSKGNIWNIKDIINQLEIKFINEVATLEEIDNFLHSQLPDILDKERFIDLKSLDKSIVKLNKELRKKNNIEDALKSLFMKFDDLVVFPIYYITKLYPFSIDNNSYYEYFTLYTDNKELYDFFKSLKKETIKDNLFQCRVVELLLYNSFYHVKYIGKNETNEKYSKLCIHNLHSFEKCQCIRCCYDRLDFENSIIKLEYNSLNTFYDKMKYCYMHYEYGNYKEAYSKYNELSEEAYKIKKYVNYYIIKYNLKNLFYILRTIIRDDSLNKIFSELKEIDLNLILFELWSTKKIDYAVYEILYWISNSNFIDNKIISTIKLVDKCLDYHRKDKIGSKIETDEYKKLNDILYQINSFIDGNLIISYNFQNYNLLAHKSIGAFLSIHNLSNPESVGIKEINNLVLNKTILFCNPDELNSIFIKYLIKESQKINFSDNKVFIQNTENFINSLEYINNNKNFFEKNKFSDIEFFKKINEIFSNLCLLLSKININEDEFNELFTKIIKTYLQYDFIYPNSIEYIISIIKYNTTYISNSVLKLIIHTHILNEKFQNERILSKVTYIIEKRRLVLDDLNDDLINYFHELIKIATDYNADEIVDTYKLISDKSKPLIKNDILKQLSTKFSARLYYLSSIYNVIDYKIHFTEYVNLIPMFWMSRNYFDADSIKDFNQLLSNFINLSYKYDIDLKQAEYQKLHNEVPYYKWLLNLQDFDYSNFNIFWILEYQTKYYFNAFKKITMLKKIIKEYLDENYVESIAKIYIEHFSD